ncbi:MAG: sigma-70 family RNA polymerase sigma factor [Bacteroides sp.]|nr:sigma-70 family RNA polymerase sigma factor [Prevotella sp.]MCM1408643.1 sigma-70 family RNA polymerase sigma factor [Treponema brennaborense]MCM1470717.1 sigma-70 family RNA polymerase sigma factor [Bacteroides sp.]
MAVFRTDKLSETACNSNHAAAAKRDAALVREVKAGDTQKFAELIKLYRKRVFALGWSFFKNASDADDFVQDVFLKAFMKLSTFRGESLFSTWLLRIAYNTAVNAVNRRKEYVSLCDEMPVFDTDLGPEARHLRKAAAESVREAISGLPEKYVLCLDMYFFYDMPYKEISEVIALPVNTIKSHIFRAKKILREKLADIVH